jgi:aminopeptidase
MSSSALVLPFDLSAAGASVAGANAQELWNTTPSGDKPPKVGTTRTFFNTPQGKTATISSLGEKFAQKKDYERRELVRKAVGAGVKELKNYDGVKEVCIDASSDPHAAGMSNVSCEE